MSFVAIDSESGERIVVTRLRAPREDLKGRSLKCQLCDGRMYLRGGATVRFHFYHHRDCTTDYATNPETPEHLAGKAYIGEYFLPKLKDYAAFLPEYEERVPEIKRVADVMLEFKMGWRIAHEVQLSRIGVEELNQRTNDYLKAGIDVLWWFGKGADSRTNRLWAIQRYGFSLTLKFDEEMNVECGCWREVEGRDHFGRKYKTERYRTDADVGPNEDPPVLMTVAYWWLEYSLCRYYQVWKKGNNSLYERGFGATKRTIASFNGTTGSGKGKRFKKSENGDWVVDLQAFLAHQEKYNKVRRLPDDVVAAIKARATQSLQQK